MAFVRCHRARNDRGDSGSDDLRQAEQGAQRISHITGCKFSRESPLLSLALVEVQNTGRVWCRQKNVR